MPIVRIGAPLDAQRGDQAVVHQPGEIADGLIGALGRLTVNDQRVGRDSERDVSRRNQTVGRHGNAGQRGLNGRVGRWIEGHRSCGGSAHPREVREDRGPLRGHRAGGR